MTEIQLNAVANDRILQVASAGSVYNVCSNRAVPVMDMVRILLSLSPIGTSIVLRSHPDRFRAFDERILLVGKSRISDLSNHVGMFMQLSGRQHKAGRKCAPLINLFTCRANNTKF
jgi:hypothetical protein